jgi:hypothetical protein
MGKRGRGRGRKRKKTMPRRGPAARQETRDSTAHIDRTLRVIEGGAPLETRPEYIAHMQAWREAGCPPG